MSHIPAVDVSQWQGNINWNAVRDAGYQIAIIKAGGADAGLYTDSKFNQNYYGAKAAGLLVAGYYFASSGDPVNQADHFVSLMSPLEENDVFVLDFEFEHPDPNGFCWAFVSRIRERTGVWPLFYTNGSRINQFGFNRVRENCGTWVAWYGQDPEGNLPIAGAYVMHQYTSSGSVPGIAGRVDLDAWFGSLEQFKKYGYHNATPAPAPQPEPQPVPPPVPVPDPTPVPVPTPTPDPTPEPTPTPTPTPDPLPTPEPTPQPEPTPPSTNWKKIVAGIIAAVAAGIAAVVTWLHS
jgi:GH25 family lysozyme M1 (1,4-beta-N-acetylmuramidase)